MRYGGVYSYPDHNLLRDATIHDVMRCVEAKFQPYEDPHEKVVVILKGYDNEAKISAQALIAEGWKEQK